MSGGRHKRHLLVVEIECLDAQGQRQAQDRLHGWLETFGFTACSHGFEFKTVGVLTGKLIKAKRRKQKFSEVGTPAQPE